MKQVESFRKTRYHWQIAWAFRIILFSPAWMSPIILGESWFGGDLSILSSTVLIAIVIYCVFLFNGIWGISRHVADADFDGADRWELDSIRKAMWFSALRRSVFRKC